MIIYLFMIMLFSRTEVAFSYQFTKEFNDCDKWAGEGECFNNPSFMWKSCLHSCIEFAQDDNDKCSDWSAEGECSNNPSYIQYHCPRSCGFGAAWNPWLRSKLGIQPLPFYDEIASETSSIANDIFSASQIVLTRLSKFMHGGHSSVKQLSTSAPSEYHGVLGLAEAMLYVLRLHEAMAKLHNHDEIFSNTVMRAQEITELLGQGYSADLIGKKLTDFLGLLTENNAQVNSAFIEVDPAGELAPASVGGIPLEDLATHYLGPVPTDSGVPVVETVTLANGVKMPSVGLGTWQIMGQDCTTAVYESIRMGYRSIDTAQAYRNEKEVGVAIAAVLERGIVRREELFIATKLSDPSFAGYENVKSLVAQQLIDLQVSYLDLYMLHSPLESSVQAETWRALEELYDQGIIKVLGVSNFDEPGLRYLVENSRIPPLVVQNKLDVYHVGKQLDNRGDKIIAYTRDNNILMVSYSTISSYPFVMNPIFDPIVEYVAEKHSRNTGENVSSAQVLLRWALQKGFAVIPRSKNVVRLKENYDVLKMIPLDAVDIHILDTLQFLVSSPVCLPVKV